MKREDCAGVMRIQEKRHAGLFHLSLEAFMPMWDAAVVAGETLLNSKSTQGAK